MKKLFLSVVISMLFMYAHATIRTASVTGNWNTPGTWGGTVPASNDDVVINTGVTEEFLTQAV